MRPNGVYLLLLVPVGFFIYLSVTPARDFYPFYEWSMFSSAREQMIDFEVRVTCLDTTCGLDESLMSNVRKYLGYYDRKVYPQVMAVGEALIDSGTVDSEDYIFREANLVRHAFQGFNRVSFALLRRHFRPLEYAKSETINRTELLVRRECKKTNNGEFDCSNI